ncbi:hypothetical protein D3C76_599740 [compost metagenome]
MALSVRHCSCPIPVTKVSTAPVSGFSKRRLSEPSSLSEGVQVKGAKADASRFFASMNVSITFHSLLPRRD